MKVLALVGSLRKNGNTSRLIREALLPFDRKGWEQETIYLGDLSIGSCRGCEGCGRKIECVLKDDMTPIYSKLIEADALIIGSPTYFYNVPGTVKTFLDRLYAFEFFDPNDRSIWMGLGEVLGTKYAATIAVCEQHSEEDLGYTSVTLDKTLEAVGYRIAASVKSLGLFGPGEADKSSRELEKARRAGEKLLKTVTLRQSLDAGTLR